MTVIASSPNEAVVRILASHPNVLIGSRQSADNAVEIDQDGWKRRLVVGDASVEVAGLIETMDNNPMVCADVVSVPGPAATLSLIALDPLVRSGLLSEPPAIQIAGCDEEDVEAFLVRAGWQDGAAVDFGTEDLGPVIAANVIALVPGECAEGEIVDLFRECYGRSLFVREHDSGKWDTSLVVGKPFALYRVTVHPAAPAVPAVPAVLVTVQVMADRDGKGGAAQVVHALNVMCGFAESAGIVG